MTSPRKTDHYSRKAKKEGYAARAVYKLEELDKKYLHIGSGYRVLNLGASPGSWMQYVSKKIASSGLQVGVDVEDVGVPIPSNTVFLKQNIFELHAENLAEYGPNFDLVISDMAPKTTGVRLRDHTRSIQLCEKARELALQMLKPGGSFLCKMYQGSETKPFLEGLREAFDRVFSQKPQASTSQSREVFVVALKRLAR